MSFHHVLLDLTVRFRIVKPGELLNLWPRLLSFFGIEEEVQDLGKLNIVGFT